MTHEFLSEVHLLTSATQSRSVIQHLLSPVENQIFVVMKFGDEDLDSAYLGVIKPLGEEFGYRVVRVDEIQDSGNITEQILENIAKSKLVLVDLTGERPNCYYEAGFAHALGKQVIFAVRNDNPVHFDLASHRFIKWRTEQDYRTQLRERLQSITDGASSVQIGPSEKKISPTL